MVVILWVREKSLKMKSISQPLLIFDNEEYLMNAFAYNSFDTDTAYRNVFKPAERVDRQSKIREQQQK